VQFRENYPKLQTRKAFPLFWHPNFNDQPQTANAGPDRNPKPKTLNPESQTQVENEMRVVEGERKQIRSLEKKSKETARQIALANEERRISKAADEYRERAAREASVIKVKRD